MRTIAVVNLKGGVAKTATVINVAAVRRGRWEQHLLPLAWKCSVCRYRTSNRALKYNHMNYCPNCGAKMDGEEKSK